MFFFGNGVTFWGKQSLIGSEFFLVFRRLNNVSLQGRFLRGAAFVVTDKNKSYFYKSTKIKIIS